MKLPFTTEQFLKVFETYNLAVWPMQIVLYVLALCAVYFGVKKGPVSGRIIFLLLAAFWIWMGIVYHLVFFTAINKAAWIFGAAFIAEGMLFIYAAFSKSSPTFQFQPGLKGITGGLLIFFALFIYTMLGKYLGHNYPSAPGFGLPCPTTIFTFGLLLWADKRIPLFLLIIPFAWSVIGFSAAFTLGIKEDISLILSGLITAFLVALHNKKYRRAEQQS